MMMPVTPHLAQHAEPHQMGDIDLDPKERQLHRADEGSWALDFGSPCQARSISA